MKPIFAIFCAVCLCGMLCLHSACDNEIETLPLEYGLSYFPLDSGHWVIYDVDSVIFSKFLTGGRDSISAQLKEVVAGVFIDNEGREARKVERYVRYDENQVWAAIDPIIWYALRDSQRAERMEGDLRFIKMVFPVDEGKSWNGNIFINTGNADLKLYNNWNYTYADVHEPATITAHELDGTPRSHSFDSTVTVIQTTREDNDNLVEFSYSTEQYANGIGLISKELWLLDIGGKPIENPDTWPDRAETGFIANYRLLDYGN